MGQRVVVDADGNVRVIETGPIGPTGLGSPGPSLAVRGNVDTWSELPLTGDVGDIWIATDSGHAWAWDGSTWVDSGIFGPDPEMIADAVSAEVATLSTLDDGFGTRLRSTPGIIRVDRSLIHVKPVLQVVNTAVETSLIDGAKPIIPAGLLSNGKGMLRVSAFSALTNNTGVDRVATIRAKLGSSTIFTWTTTAIPSNASNRQLKLEFEFRTINPLFGYQPIGVGTLTLSAPGGDAPDQFQFTRYSNPIPSIPLESFETPLTFDLSVQLVGAAHANFSFLNGYIHLDPVSIV